MINPFNTIRENYAEHLRVLVKRVLSETCGWCTLKCLEIIGLASYSPSIQPLGDSDHYFLAIAKCDFFVTNLHIFSQTVVNKTVKSCKKAGFAV